MHFHHLHFYVENAAYWQDWFIQKLAFHASTASNYLVQGDIRIRLSDPVASSAAANYLKKHPPGLADIAFATERFEEDLHRAIAQGAECLSSVTGIPGHRQCQLKGWGDVCHTLVEVADGFTGPAAPASNSDWLSVVDHAVLNVPEGQLTQVSAWYKKVFGLVSGQHFEISTAHSGLRSQVLIHPNGTLQLPINEPSSANSQIQEFLEANRGAGVQHVALRSENAVGAIAHLRQQGLRLLNVPKTYYEGLTQRLDCPLTDISAARAQQLLLDWAKGGNQGLLMQTFTKPIFQTPTFFFEIIERGTYTEQGQLKCAQGFGEGNFQALFEAIERDQRSRGSLA